MVSGPAEADTPQMILDLADVCVRFVKRSLGIELDYTPETLPILDHYLKEARTASREEVLRLVAPAAGAYFGEVLRQHLGDSRWHLEGDDFSRTRLEFTRCFLSFNPVASALSALLGEDVDDEYGGQFELLPEDRGLVHEALDKAGDVRAEDFHRLAIRYEVLETIVSLLTEKAIVTGEEGRVYGRDVYAALREQKTTGVLH